MEIELMVIVLTEKVMWLINKKKEDIKLALFPRLW